MSMSVTDHEEIVFWHELENIVRQRCRASGIVYDGISSGSIVARQPYYPATSHRIVRHPVERKIVCSLETTADGESSTIIAREITFDLVKVRDGELCLADGDWRLDIEQMADFIMRPF